MSNHHTRIKQLEKLAAKLKVKTRFQSQSKTERELEAKYAAMSDEELKAEVDKFLEEIKKQPPNPELEGLTTQQIIDKCQQLCRES